MYEIFDHTADFGLRIRADSLQGLFEEAARGLFSTIVEDLDTIRPTQQRTFQLETDRRDDLLHDWLTELLYTFHADHMLFTRFEVRLDDMRLEAVAHGEPIDHERHELDAEIKAITYHGLMVEQEKDGWLAEVIVDI